MNKFSIVFGSILILFVLICQNDTLALVSGHHKKHKTTQSSPDTAESTRHNRHSKHHISARHHKNKHIVAKPRYAYPMGFFLMEPPTFESTQLPEDISTQIKKAFYSGYAGDYPTRSLVRTGLVSYYPMRGGIFWRREPIKYLIMHSTEPGIPVGAKTIIDGWSHGGRRHAGAHYVIDRDGSIYQAVDPDLATVHINIFKTLPGINNDNSIGIEMCHHGSQDYPPALVESAARLAAYLQSHYHIADANIITHRYAQQGDHTDPVNFGWDNFIAQKDTLQNEGLNQKLALMKSEVFNWQPVLEQSVVIVVDKKAPVNQSKTDLTIIDLTKKSPPDIVKVVPAKPAVSKLIPTETESIAPKIEHKTQSPFEAKFGPINKPVTESAFEAKFGPASNPAAELTETKPTTVDQTVDELTPEIIKSATINKADTELQTEVKPTTVNKPTVEKQIPLEAQIPISAPVPSSGQARLLPTSPTSRLVPFSIIINTQRPSNAVKQESSTEDSISSPANKQTKLVPVSTINSKRLLPLRGPIEMDPDDAASLLGQ